MAKKMELSDNQRKWTQFVTTSQLQDIARGKKSAWRKVDIILVESSESGGFLQDLIK